jgi:aminoglycoside 2''-phosphotransferase
MGTPFGGPRTARVKIEGMFDWLTLPPEPEWPAPAGEELRGALARVRPDLAGMACTPLDHGWAYRAYLAGDCVLRFPKKAQYAKTLPAEARLLPVLAPSLPLPISVIALHDDGPNGLPFTSHRFVPGVKAMELGRPLTSGAAEALGRFLRALHDFPTDRALDCGVGYNDGVLWREERAQLYEVTIRRCFPLVSCEARAHIERTFETYLNDDANFAWQPTLVHNDIDERNVLADPSTGELTGVIDWGDVVIGDPAVDFSGPLVGDLAKGGLDAAALERGYGLPLEPVLQRCKFYAFCWPLFHLLHGLHTNDPEFVEDGIGMINEHVPFGVRCD